METRSAIIFVLLCLDMLIIGTKKELFLLTQSAVLVISMYLLLTVHNIIAKNASILMHKINHFPDTVPPSIRNCFPSSRPALASDHENCADWLKVYNEIPYRASIFYKGPIIAISDFNHNLITNSLASLYSLNIYKNTAKKLLLSHQSEGNNSEWTVY